VPKAEQVGSVAPPALPGFVATTSRSAPVLRFGTFLLVGPPLGLFPLHRSAGSHVPHRSLGRARAAFVPVTTRAVDRCPPSLIPDQQLESGFGDVPTLSTRCQRFTFVRLPDSHLTGLSPPFPETLTTPVIGPTQLPVVWTLILQPESEGPTLISCAAQRFRRPSRPPLRAFVAHSHQHS
jgi:hypothetical protein